MKRRSGAPGSGGLTPIHASQFPLDGYRAIARAFTLVEMLVAVTVLTILILITTEIVANTSRMISSSNKMQSADEQARMTFDRLSTDIANLVRRPDLDAIFPKQTGNDQLFFYSEAPAYFDTSNSSLFPGSNNPDPKNPLSLIGYRINSSYQLERLGLGLTWDGTTPPGSVVFLSYLNGLIDPKSTLPGAYPEEIGSAPSYNGSDTTYWQAMAAQVFRLEICFLLNDGTLSTIPMVDPNPNNSNTNLPSDNIAAAGPPSVSTDSSAGYSTGSRWFDTVASRGYICLNNSLGAAVWQPLGARDVRAIVVAIAVLDETSQKIVTSSQIASLAGKLPDEAATDLTSTPPVLMLQKWQALLQSPSFATAAGIPAQAASFVRVYQRYFYFNAP